MKKMILFGLCGFFLIISSNCNKQSDSFKEYHLTGKAQKGPFSPGANVTISELDEDLNPTGRSYFTTIMDYEGGFEIPQVELTSDYIQLKVEGSQFHEFSGSTPVMADITLFCIADVAGSDRININMLTHLEKDLLIQYKNDGLPFSDAKKKAQREVLRIFNLEGIELMNSEKLDISSPENYNGVLLAVSAIIQGRFAGSALAELLTNIRNDLNDNGILDSPDIQTQLITTARLIDPDRIINNLSGYYYSHNITGYQIPEIQNYIDTFLINSDYFSVGNYTFPEESVHGSNILAFTQDTTDLDTANTYSMTVFTDINSQITLFVEMFLWEGNGKWVMSSNENWTIIANTDDNLWCHSSHQQNITADLALDFEGEGLAKLYVAIGNPFIEFSEEKFVRWGN